MIKIEVTGNSIPEVADKLLAIGASLQAAAAVVEAQGLKTTLKTATGVVKETPANSTPVSEEIEVVDLSVPALDFNKDVRELALKLVAKRGKPALEKTLAHFGVARASLVAPERLPELLAMINKALG